MNTLKKFKDNIENILNVAEEKDLSGREIAMLVAIVDLSDNEKEQCFASNATISKKINLSPNRVSSTLKKLEDKDLVSMEHFRKGTNIEVNDKNYLVYRTIVFNNKQPLTENGKGYLPKTVEGVLPKTVTKSTKSNTTKNNNTNNLSKADSIKKAKEVAEKDNAREIPQTKSEYDRMLEYAIEQTKERPNIGSVNAYARMIVKNWFRNGLTTLEAVKQSMNKTVTVKPRFEEKLPSWAINSQATSNTENNNQTETSMKEIERLMNKIDSKTKTPQTV